jgi:hypothetical protein
MPETATVRFVRPEGFEEWSQARWAQAIRDGVHTKEKGAARRRASKGLRVVGVPGILAQGWWSRPKIKEFRRKLSPRVAATHKWKRVEALLENKHFLRAYRRARDKWIAGMKNVFFPPGTYWLKRFAAVACTNSSVEITT